MQILNNNPRKQFHHPPNVKAYLAIFGVLMVLTVVTVGASYLHFPPALAILLGLFIATIKASLVAAFFMHLKGERVLIYGLLGVTFFFMALLFILPITDAVATLDHRVGGSINGSEALHDSGAEHVP